MFGRDLATPLSGPDVVGHVRLSSLFCMSARSKMSWTLTLGVLMRMDTTLVVKRRLSSRSLRGRDDSSCLFTRDSGST